MLQSNQLAPIMFDDIVMIGVKFLSTGQRVLGPAARDITFIVDVLSIGSNVCCIWANGVVILSRAYQSQAFQKADRKEE